jgi:hypothetical protein
MEVISMKFRFNFNLEVWVDGIEIEAKSEEEAIEQLYKMSVKEYLEEGYDRDSDISDIDSEVIEKSIKVKAYDIEYDIEEDIWFCRASCTEVELYLLFEGLEKFTDAVKLVPGRAFASCE